MSEVKSRTIKLTNAYVTLHPHSSGTSILNITVYEGDAQHVAVWMGEEDITELAALLREWEGDPPKVKAKP